LIRAGVILVTDHGLAAVVNFKHTTQHYYLATVLSGPFGAGTGPELTSPPTSESGTYRAVWLPLSDLTTHDLRPPSIAAALQCTATPDRLLQTWLTEPPTFEEV
jgi:hypothetical protein